MGDMKNIKNIIGILSGVITLFFGFYLMYLGSDTDNGIITAVGGLVAILSSIIIYVFRHKHNMKLIYNYKKAIEDLKKDPNNQELIDKAYKYGKEFYRARSGGNILSKKEQTILERDIDYTRGKLKE